MKVVTPLTTEVVDLIFRKAVTMIIILSSHFSPLIGLYLKTLFNIYHVFCLEASVLSLFVTAVST